jgi:hypothetical protein
MKNYKIKSNTAQMTVLEGDFTYGFSIVIFVCIGLIFLGIAVFLFAEEQTFNRWANLFALMGLTIMYVGLIMPRTQAKYSPHSFVFDHQAAQLKIIQDRESTQSITIPYADIDSFDIKTVVSSSSSPNTSTRIRSYTYYPHVVKKDSGMVEFGKTHNLQYAQDLVDMLNAARQNALAEPKTATVNYTLPQKISKTIKGDAIILQWRNVVNWLKLLGTLLICCTLTVFIVQVGGLLLAEHEDIWFLVYFFFGFMFLIMLMILISTLYDLWKNFNTTFGISISKTSLEFFENDLNGRLKKSEILTLKDIGAIIFNFQISENNNNAVQILTKEQFTKMQTMRNESEQFSWSAITDGFKLARQVRRIDIQALNVVERIQLEYWLQQTLRERGNDTVL